MSQVPQCDSDKIVGQETRIVIHPFADNEFIVMGLNNAQLPGWTTDTINDDSFDKKIVGKIPGSRSYTDTQFSCYMIARDKAQEELRILSLNNTLFNDLFYYYSEKEDHFWALDLINDPCGQVGISGYAPQSYGRTDLVQVQFNLTVNGMGGQFEYHTPGDLSYDVVAGVLTVGTPPSGFSFVTLGFKAGMVCIVETGNASNPYFYAEIAAGGVAAAALTFVDTTLADSNLSGAIHAARVK
jgi:hypothetical protein